MLLPWPYLVVAQQSKKVPRIGYLSPRHGIEPREQEFRKGLRELGYIEGENITIEWRFTEGKRERQVDLVADLVRLKVDCIVTAGSAATQAAKQTASTIPIVMTNVGDDPVRQGFVASLARPGGNITGLTIMGADLAGKRLELVKESFPKVSRVVILWDSTNPGLAAYVRETEVASRALGSSFKTWSYEVPRTKILRLRSRRQRSGVPRH
jgi:putative ABC transport system substrate-binding protein